MAAMSKVELGILGATNGAFSIVTRTEATHDRAVTVDRFEKQALGSSYPLVSFTRKGGGLPDGKPDRFVFLVHRRDSLSGPSLHDLAVNYPKSKGSELRIYNSDPTGFAAQEGDVFYIYVTAQDAEPHVGYASKSVWDGFWANPSSQAAAAISVGTVDLDDEVYQRAMESAAANVPVATTGMRYPTDPMVGLSAKIKANFKCEIDPMHSTFVSAATAQHYVEAHHLVPMSAQAGFEKTLDVTENIVSLCPNCHRAIHLAEASARVAMLISLHSSRQQNLARRGINVSVGELLKIYNIV